ncbi:MAG: hypothetical protein U5S82_06855 [Gammaproteobacteria bacterium]|nr:hypothetical protein [Gammaproteobacteria bacterium]
MRLADVTVALRPRSPWEASDLGLAMTQAWWRAVYPPFLLLVLSVYGVVSLLLWSSPAWVPVVMWWLKPLFDRLLLHVYSQGLFGALPATGQTLRALPGLMSNGLGLQLSLLRLDTIRSFRTPIMQLERLHGRARRERLRTLARRGRSQAALLTLVCVHMEVILVIGVVVLAAVMVPAGMDVDVIDRLTAATGPEALLWNLLLMAGFLVVEPFYVAAGFAIYLNRRSELEGWDIELRLRRIAARLAGTAALVLAVVLVPLPQAGASAFDTPVHDGRRPSGEAGVVAAEVLAHEDFDTTRRFTVWRWRGESADEEPSLDPEGIARWVLWLARATEGLLWGMAAALVVAALYYGRRWLPRGRRRPRETAIPAAPRFAGDAQQAPLPADVPAAARELWAAGRRRAALSLLYRGCLAAAGAGVRDSATEDEVLAALHGALPAGDYAYVARVTRLWQAAAYARQLPRQAEFEDLLRGWPRAEGRP